MRKNRNFDKENSCKKNRNAGFTLVELLIAMLMTMIIVSGIGQFMASTSRTYQTLDNQVNLQMEAQCTINMITDMILEGNNVVFDETNKMLRIYKNLGTKDSRGNLVNNRTAEQNIIWFDESNHKMYLFECKSGSDYDKAYTSREGKKLMAEGVYGFEVTCPSVTDWSQGLVADRNAVQRPCVTVSVLLQTKAAIDGKEDDFTYKAEDSVSPRNEIVKL